MDIVYETMHYRSNVPLLLELAPLHTQRNGRKGLPCEQFHGIIITIHQSLRRKYYLPPELQTPERQQLISAAVQS